MTLPPGRVEVEAALKDAGAGDNEPPEFEVGLVVTELLGVLEVLGTPADEEEPTVATEEALGLWPAKNEMVCPVLWGSEAMFARLVESLNATVADAELVQLQYEPGWSVDGLPCCEQIAQAPPLLSQRVRATHGWSRAC